MTASQYTNGRGDEKNLFHELLIRADEKKSFLIGMGLVALAKLQGVFAQVYAVDDYIQMISGLTSLRNALISQGRFGEYWLAELFSFIGFDPIRSPLLSMVLSIFLSTYVANAILRLWRVELPDVVRVLCIVIIAAHPYTSEILTFRGIAIYHVIAYAVAVIAFLLARWSKVGVILPAFIFSAALTIYQVPLSLVAVLLCIDCSLRLLRSAISTDDFSRVDVIDRNFFVQSVGIRYRSWIIRRMAENFDLGNTSSSPFCNYWYSRSARQVNRRLETALAALCFRNRLYESSGPGPDSGGTIHSAYRSRC